MIKEVIMYQCRCDNCDDLYHYQDWEAISDNVWKETVIDGEWWYWTEDDQVFCDKCGTPTWDEEEEDLLCFVNGENKGKILT